MFVISKLVESSFALWTTLVNWTKVLGCPSRDRFRELKIKHVRDRAPSHVDPLPEFSVPIFPRQLLESSKGCRPSLTSICIGGLKYEADLAPLMPSIRHSRSSPPPLLQQVNLEALNINPAVALHS